MMVSCHVGTDDVGHRDEDTVSKPHSWGCSNQYFLSGVWWIMSCPKWRRKTIYNWSQEQYLFSLLSLGDCCCHCIASLHGVQYGNSRVPCRRGTAWYIVRWERTHTNDTTTTPSTPFSFRIVLCVGTYNDTILVWLFSLMVVCLVRMTSTLLWYCPVARSIVYRVPYILYYCPMETIYTNDTNTSTLSWKQRVDRNESGSACTTIHNTSPSSYFVVCSCSRWLWVSPRNASLLSLLSSIFLPRIGGLFDFYVKFDVPDL